jgi:flavin reductase (DIM6/NTAB) family NADH-FMN oxidoreductase RutF
VPLEAQAFRSVAGAFPTGVVIVTTVDADGAPKGLTSQAVMAVSTDPPLFLISVDKTSRTLPYLRESGVFVANFLAAGREELSGLFASKSDDKFSAVAWRPSSIARGSAILHEDAIAYAECLITDTIEAGDHWLFIGRAEGGAVDEGTPLMYYRRSYAPWPTLSPA